MSYQDLPMSWCGDELSYSKGGKLNFLKKCFMSILECLSDILSMSEYISGK